MGEFIRDHLPEPEGYFQSQGLVLAGRGRWRTTRCTFHGGSDSMRINTASGGWCCMSCGEHGGDVLAFHQKAHGLDFVTAARELGAYVEGVEAPQRKDYRDRTAKPAIRTVEAPQPARLSDYWHRFWRNTYGLRNTVGADYLMARHCVLPPEDGDLRFHPALHHPTGYVGPALVALVTDVVTREPISLHKTWVLPDGTKPAHLGRAARRNLKGHRKQGGCIRLWPDEAMSTSLGAAEGIESALSLAHAHQPVWSLIDAGNLASLPVVAGIECLLIGADNDNAGIKAAHECGTRWRKAGTRVYIVTPPQERTDLNDIAKEAT